MKYLLDTNACIAILNGKDPELLAKLNDIGAQNICICSVVRGELLFGARKSLKVEKNLSRIQEFFSGLGSVSYDDSAAEFYGTIRALLEKIGQRIGENDLLIASIALSNNLVLISKNRKEFIRVPGLRLEDW